jgi:hypothetical protein
MNISQPSTPLRPGTGVALLEYRSMSTLALEAANFQQIV